MYGPPRYTDPPDDPIGDAAGQIAEQMMNDTDALAAVIDDMIADSRLPNLHRDLAMLLTVTPATEFEAEFRRIVSGRVDEIAAEKAEQTPRDRRGFPITDDED